MLIMLQERKNPTTFVPRTAMCMANVIIYTQEPLHADYYTQIQLDAGDVNGYQRR